MANDERFLELYDRYCDGTLEPAERDEFLALMADPSIRARFAELSLLEAVTSEEMALRREPAAPPAARRWRPGFAAAAAVLVVAAAAFLVLRSGPGTRPPHGPPFVTADEAFDCIRARLLAVDEAQAVPGLDPYTRTLTRRVRVEGSDALTYVLVNTPAQERALAEGFLSHGFLREAQAHFENLASFHPEAPEARDARARADVCRQSGLDGLVPPGTPIYQDAQGRRVVPALAPPRLLPVAPPDPGDAEAFARFVRDPALPAAGPVTGPLTPIGRFMDDVTGGERVGNAIPNTAPFPGQDPAAASYYMLPLEARTLADAERIGKRRLLDTLRGRLGKPAQALGAAWRRLADAYLYLGEREEAVEILAGLGEPPADPFAGGLETVASDPASPLALDARWLLDERDAPRFTIATRSCVTTEGTIPVDVDAHRVGRLTFSFHPATAEVPAAEKDVRAWLAAVRSGERAAASPEYVEIAELRDGPNAIRLPLRRPGTYRVVVEGGGASCAFIASRTDASLEAFIFPEEKAILASSGGYHISCGRTLRGITDAEGFLDVPSLEGTVCDAHRECCADCDSCLHHHSGGYRYRNVFGVAEKENRVDPLNYIVFASGHGQFFRATARLDTSEVGKAGVGPAGAVLFVHTDRPAYKAGDTMRFRGILRVPKSPTSHLDASRYDVAAGQSVDLSIRYGQEMLFSQTYMTGVNGTFNGEFPIPPTAPRTGYVLLVQFHGTRVEQPFLVMDYRKNDFAVFLSPQPGGLLVHGGYVWGSPVSGAALECRVDGAETKIQDGFVPLKDGQKIEVSLRRDGKALAEKTLVYRTPSDTPPAAAEKTKTPPQPAGVPAPFTIRPRKTPVGRGEDIELEVTGPWAEADAVVVLGDVRLYDLARVRLRDGRATVRFPARPVHDPQVAAFALCEGRQARADVHVCAALMPVGIAAPRYARPGETVEVRLSADPGADLAVAAVDEACFMIREDDTPEMYRHFYPVRPAALAYGRFTDIRYDGERRESLRRPAHKGIRCGAAVEARLARTVGIQVHPICRKDVTAKPSIQSDRGESSCMQSLLFLAKEQGVDGSWDSAFLTEAGPVSRTGVTGLAISGFLGAGYTHLSRDSYEGICFGTVVKEGIQWIQRQQGPDGTIGSKEKDWILDHTLAAFALCEAYGMTSSPRFKEPAQRAIDALVAVQSPDGGWRRGGSNEASDVLVSSFANMALKSAEISGLVIPDNTGDRALAYVKRTLGDDARCGGHPTLAKVGGCMLSILYWEKSKGNPVLKRSADWIIRQVGMADDGDFLGRYLASLALFQFDGPGGPYWSAWNEQIWNVLVRALDSRGSWSVLGEAFYHTALGTLTAETYYRYANVFGAPRMLRSDAPPWGDAQGKGAQDETSTRPGASPRLRVWFPDTVLWMPSLLADANGEARLRLPLPDSITTTRLTARGITPASAAGQATARVETRMPFFVKIACPEFLVLGDEVEVRVEAHNGTGAPLAAEIELEGVGRTRLDVPADWPAAAAWRVRATDTAGLVLTARGRAGTLADAMTRTIPVRLPGLERRVVRRESAAANRGLRFEAPDGVRSLVVRVHPGGGLLEVLGALRYLNEYPYGCVEQTLSRFLPNVLTAEVLKQFNIPSESFNRSLADMMRVGLERLKSLQRPGGDWGWYENDNADLFMTTRVMEGLQACERCGYAVDKPMIKNGRVALIDMAEGVQDPDLLAYATFVLADGFGPLEGADLLVFGRGRGEAVSIDDGIRGQYGAHELGSFINKLLERDAALSPYARAFLVLALKRLGQPEAEAQARALAAAARDDHWEVATWRHRWEKPDIEATCYAIQALAAVDPHHPLIPKAAEWLLGKRDGNRWTSTKDTAVAIATLLKVVSVGAVADAVTGRAAKPAEGATWVRRLGLRLNSGDRREIVLDFARPLMSRFEAHLADVKPGTNTLVLESLDGRDDPVPYGLSLEMTVVDPAETPPETAGIAVRVAYDRPLEALQIGDEVTATVTVTSDGPVDYAMVLSPIPAGCEVVRGSGTGPFARFEDRYDQAIFFLRSAGAEPVTLTYRMLCSFAGRFTVRAPWAGLMYNEAFHGTGAAGRAEIRP